MEQDRRRAVVAGPDADAAGWEDHLRRDLADSVFAHSVGRRFHT